MTDHAMSAVETAKALILDEIEQLTTSDGGRLDSERDLAEKLGLSRWTIRQALAELEEQQLVRRVVGRNGGTFLGPARVAHSSGGLAGLSVELSKQGFQAGYRVISAVTVPSDPVCARHLRIEPGAFVHSITRIRLADGVPLSLENMQLPMQLVPDLFDHALNGSLYSLLTDQYGIAAGMVDETIETAIASAEHSSVLDIELGEPVLSLRRTSRTADDVPFEFSNDIFRGDRTRIVVSSAATSPIEVKIGT